MVLYNIEYRAFVLLICVGLLAIRPHQVCGSRKVVLGARNHHRMIKAIDHHMNSLGTDKKRASVVSKKYDANQSSKRTVRRGSDPIHNRTWSRAMCIARQWKQRHTEETLHQCIKIGRSSLWKFGLVLDNSLFLGFLADVRYFFFFFSLSKIFIWWIWRWVVTIFWLNVGAVTFIHYICFQVAELYVFLLDEFFITINSNPYNWGLRCGMGSNPRPLF